MKPFITGVTVSVEVGDKEYGNGTSSFMNIQARYPNEGAPLEEVEDVIDHGLDMYFAAWRALLASRCATGIISGSDYKEQLGKVTSRFEKVRNILKAGNSGQ